MYYGASDAIENTFDNPSFVSDELPAANTKSISTSKVEVPEYDPHDFGNQHHATSYWGTVFHIYIICAGPLLVSLPSYFATVGVVPGFVATVLVALVYKHNVSMIVDAEYALCKEKKIPNLSYSDTVYYSFLTGPPMFRGLASVCRRITYIVFIVLWGGGNAAGFVLIGSSFAKLYHLISGNEEIGNTIGIYVLFVPLLILCCIPRLKFLIPVSLIGILLNIIVVIAVVYSIFSDFVLQPYQKNHTNLWKLSLFIGTILFSLNATGIMLPLKNDMKYPKGFDSFCGVLNVSFWSIGILYALFQTLCVLKYGSSIQQNVIFNLPQDTLLIKILIILYIISLCLVVPLVTYVVFDVIWNNMLKEKRDGMERTLFWEYFTRTVIVVVMFIASILLPNMDVFMSLCGTIGTSLDSIFFPATVNTFMWLKKKDSASKVKYWFVLLKNGIFIFVAVLLMLFGVKDCISEILGEF